MSQGFFAPLPCIAIRDIGRVKQVFWSVWLVVNWQQGTLTIGSAPGPGAFLASSHRVVWEEGGRIFYMHHTIFLMHHTFSNPLHHNFSNAPYTF